MAYPQETFQYSVLLSGSLIHRRREAVAANTLLYQLEVLKKTGRYDAFKLEWHPIYDEPPEIWPVPKHLFWDSDVAKWIEGACYLLHDHPHPKIDASIHELVNMIRAAQQPDGYINIHYTVVESGKRFTNLRDMHELYNAGHLIEAALAHHAYYKNNDLLDPILRYVELLHKTFGPGHQQAHGYPGHPEIELALMRLYSRTNDTNSYELASYFLTERGNPKGVSDEHYFDVEARLRGESRHARPEYHTEAGGCKWYYQAHEPLIEQQTIEGHSVRAMYLLTAASDLVRVREDTTGGLSRAVKRLWDNMVHQKMYVTGGIGAMKQYEGFGLDYFLPQGTDEGGCYAETCASIGVMMLAQRMLQYDLNGEYADIMELCLYNAVLTAMSHDGQQFTYVNQLASSDADPAKRSEWFTVACCPPNILRLLGSIGGYIYTCHNSVASSTVTVDVHLYIPSKHEFVAGGHACHLAQESRWPWEGDVKLKLEAPQDVNIELRLRIPAWASSWKIVPELSGHSCDKGYLTIPSEWLKQHSTFTLSVPLQPRMMSPHPYANQDTLTLARGPIVYCVEDVDNSWVQDHFKSTYIKANATIEEAFVHESVTGDGYVALTINNGAISHIIDPLSASPGLSIDKLDSGGGKAKAISKLHFVPFYFRANRGGKGQSRVGLRRWHAGVFEPLP